MKKRKDFDPLLFMIQNNLPLDKICGTFPLVFKDYKVVSHALHMAWAFLLTMRMKKLDRVAFNQRTKDKSFRPKMKNLFTILFVHIFSQIKTLRLKDEKAIVKCLKNSLCFHVSEVLAQEELPTGTHFNMIPFELRKYFKELEQGERIDFFFSLLQSKDLCKEVPESFVQDALLEHFDKLSSPSKPLESSIIETLKERGRKFGRNVKKFYKPNQGFYPTNAATFGFPRANGGVKGDLVSQDCLKNYTHTSSSYDRMEPFVIGLFGQPGQGKSSQIPLLLSKLSKLFPGIRRQELTYSRSCNVDHWDGYNNQPITILDDIGQSLEGKDIKEFQTLVSCCPYVLPMADLTEKGTLFTSPIIIVTSNLQYGSKLSAVYEDQAGILDDASFWRRFSIPLYVEDRQIFQLKEEPLWTRTDNLIARPGLTRHSSSVRTFDFSKVYYQRKTLFCQPTGHQNFEQGIWKPIGPDFLDLLVSVYRSREKFHENIRRTWTQVIESTVETPQTLVSEDWYEQEIAPHLPKSLGFDSSPQLKSNTYALEFDAFPPVEPLPIRVEPIKEPLKVRIITAAKGETFCLKPLQRAMWLALGEEEQFCLTHGTENLYPGIEKIHSKSGPFDVWMSGDYSAATDSIPIEATKALFDGIFESIEHEPTKRWAMKEISPHLLVYPPGSGIKPALQESGQLMGSLLSFPLLCLLNDCTAQAIGLRPHQYLINGDDILMRGPANLYPKWREVVGQYGLTLSPGKNYIHPVYGTVNSQLIMGNTVLDSGKQKVLDRRSKVLGECLRDLEMMMSRTGAPEVHELFKTVNRSKLSRTVRSIDVPVSHGGLSLNWGPRANLSERSSRTEILVYLWDLFKKIEPEKDCISIPYLSQRQLIQKSIDKMDEAFNLPVTSSEYHEDFIGTQELERVRKRIHTNSHLRNLFFGQSIEDLPSLSFLGTIQVPFKDKKTRSLIQTEIDRVFLQNFLDSNKEFSYESFRSLFLEAVRGTPTATEVATRFLVPIIELDVRPDYLTKVLKGYTAKTFDKGNFEKSLGKILRPKSFDLPPCSDSPDFSQEVVQSFDALLLEMKGNDEPWMEFVPRSDLSSLYGSFQVGNDQDEQTVKA